MWQIVTGILSGVFSGAVGGVVRWGAIATVAFSALLLIRSDWRAPLKIRLEQQQAINAEVARRVGAVRKELRQFRASRKCTKERVQIKRSAERLEQILHDMRYRITHLGRVDMPQDRRPEPPRAGFRSGAGPVRTSPRGPYAGCGEILRRRTRTVLRRSRRVPRLVPHTKRLGGGRCCTCSCTHQMIAHRTRKVGLSV